LTGVRRGKYSSAGHLAGASRVEVKGRESGGSVQRDEGWRGVRL
jgi:hypothetical protein